MTSVLCVIRAPKLGGFLLRALWSVRSKCSSNGKNRDQLPPAP